MRRKTSLVGLSSVGEVSSTCDGASMLLTEVFAITMREFDFKNFEALKTMDFQILGFIFFTKRIYRFPLLASDIPKFLLDAISVPL